MSSMNSRYKTYNPEKQYFVKHNKNVYMTIGLVRTVSWNKSWLERDLNQGSPDHPD